MRDFIRVTAVGVVKLQFSSDNLFRDDNEGNTPFSASFPRYFSHLILLNEILSSFVKYFNCAHSSASSFGPRVQSFTIIFTNPVFFPKVLNETFLHLMYARSTVRIRSVTWQDIDNLPGKKLQQLDVWISLHSLKDVAPLIMTELLTLKDYPWVR